MGIKTEYVGYSDGALELEAFIARDDAWTTPRPAVLVSHAWAGRDEFACGKARAMAELGYVGFALDMYGKGVLGGSPEENAALMRPFVDDRAMLQRRIQVAFDAVCGLPVVDGTRVAAMGFCFGGMCVLDLARTGTALRGVVSVHGLLKPAPVQARTIAAKVLVLHGHDDPMVPVDEVLALEKELDRAGADWQVHVYGGTMHAFSNPAANDPASGKLYSERAERRAWRSTTDFLGEVLVE